MNRISDLMKETKESWVASKPENNDLAIYLHFWRGDDLVVMVQCPLDPDHALVTGQVGAQGFTATTMSMTMESYHSTSKISPITGEPWQNLEKQYVFETDPHGDHGVSECLLTSAHERGGEFAVSLSPYRIENHQVIWGEEDRVFSGNPEAEDAAGSMFDYLQHAMSQPTIDEVMAEKAADDPRVKFMSTLVMDPERRQFHTDMAILTSLEERKLVSAVMFTAEPGSLREELLRERLGDQAVVTNGKEL
jgi:hypothetical protein